MTMISSDQVTQLASLSSLQLSDEDAAAFRQDIAMILEHVTVLQGLETDGVEPTYQVNDLQNVWRDDVVEESISGAELVSLAPDHTDTTITVPKVL